MAVRVKALERAVEQLVNVHGENNSMMKRAFTMTDQHVMVLQRVARDEWWGTVRPIPLHEEDQEYLNTPGLTWSAEKRHGFMKMDGQIVDFSWYHMQFFQASQLTTFVDVMRKIFDCWKLPEPMVEAADGTEETTEEFGGDYGQG